MPQIVDLTQPYGGKGKYGDTFQGIADILDNIGNIERIRQDRSLNAKIINVVAMGGGPQEIAQAMVENQPQYSSGSVGFLQRIANKFTPPSMIEGQVGQMGIQSAMRPVSAHQKISEKKLAMIEKAEAEGDQEKVERLMGVRKKELEGMTREERIKALQTGLNAAAGTYFYQEGLEGGSEKPKNPVLYDFYADLLREEGIPVKERPGRKPKPGNLLRVGPGAGPKVGPRTGGALPPLPGHPFPHEGVYRDFGIEIPEFSVTLDALNQAYKDLPAEKKPRFEAAWKKAQEAGATPEEFLAEWQK